MEASYEVLGDVHSEEAPSEEEVEEVNGEDVQVEFDNAARGFLVRTGIAALGFAMAIVGIWGDGAPQPVVFVS
jgi:autophagy-related protein 33